MTERNRHERVEGVVVVYDGEQWTVTSSAIRPDGRPAWYTAHTVRNGVRFERTFSPDEVNYPEVEAGEGYYNCADPADI